MFPSYLLQDVCRCCSFLLYFCKRIFNNLVESLQRKQTGDGFVQLTILTKLKRQETALIIEMINMDFQNNIRENSFVYELATPAVGTTCKVIKLIL